MSLLKAFNRAAKTGWDYLVGNNRLQTRGIQNQIEFSENAHFAAMGVGFGLAQALQGDYLSALFIGSVLGLAIPGLGGQASAAIRSHRHDREQANIKQYPAP